MNKRERRAELIAKRYPHLADLSNEKAQKRMDKLQESWDRIKDEPNITDEM